MNYRYSPQLRMRIESAEEAMHKSTATKKGFWSGYITALKDIRDDTNTGGEE